LEVGAEGGFKLDLRLDRDPGKQELKGAVRTETYRRHYCQHSSLFCLLRKGGVVFALASSSWQGAVQGKGGLVGKQCWSGAPHPTSEILNSLGFIEILGWIILGCEGNSSGHCGMFNSNLGLYPLHATTPPPNDDKQNFPIRCQYFLKVAERIGREKSHTKSQSVGNYCS
jgi:hypothetical protein